MIAPPYAHIVTSDRLVTLHALGLAHAGTIGPPADIDCLEGRLGNAWAAEQYRLEEGHVELGLLFACYLMVYLIRDNCAVDGNKRLGWLALVEVLSAYDLEIVVPDDEAEQMCTRVLTDNLMAEDIADWMLDRLVELPDRSV